MRLQYTMQQVQTLHCTECDQPLPECDRQHLIQRDIDGGAGNCVKCLQPLPLTTEYDQSE